MTTTALQTYPINYISSDTGTNNQAFIQQLYSGVLGRSADQSGLQYWTTALNNHEISRDAVIQRFFASKEIQNTFQNPTEAVTSIYHSILTREPDSAGLNFWTKQISSGSSTIGDVVKTFLTSNEFYKLQSTNASVPTINVLWQDQPSWDSITATQLAKLIAYSPDGGNTHPNSNLEFVVSGYGPNSGQAPSAPSHAGLIATLPNNTADALVQFLQSVSDQASSLSKGKVNWGVNGGTGSIVYHPDMTTGDYNKDWSQWAPDGKTPDAIPDQTYIDYSLYLSNYLSSHNLKGFSQVVFESEGSQDGSNTALFGSNGQQNGNLFQYKGNPYLLNEYKISNWHDVFAATATGGPAGNSANWSKLSSGFSSDMYLAQAYDLIGAGYIPDWSGISIIDPKNPSVTPSEVAISFAKFFADPTDANKIQAVNNIKYLWNTPGSSSGTSYNPNATIVFAYGEKDNHDPQFQNTTYSNNPPQANTSDGYTWTANDFASFLSGSNGSVGFVAQLNNNLTQILGSFPSSSTPSIGVWGGERALDAWFGVGS